MRRRYYRVTHTPPRPCPNPDPLIVEGYATSPYNACKIAFRALISEGYINQAPLFDKNTESFPHTEVEIIPEPEHESE